MLIKPKNDVLTPPEARRREALPVLAPDCGDAHCAACPSHDHCLPAEPLEGALSGAKLSLAAVGVFVFPLALALLGALAGAHHGAVGQLVGGLAGLFGGMLLVHLIARLLHPEPDPSGPKAPASQRTP